MKRIFPLLLIIVIIFTSCGEKKGDTYNAHKKLAEMKSYTAVAEVTVNSNKGTTTYKVKQYYSDSNKLRIETLEPDFLKGKVLVFNGQRWKVHHPLIKQTMDVERLKDDESYIYLGIIQNSILSSEDAKYSNSKKDNKDYIEVKSTIPGGNKYRRSVALYMTKEKYYPEIMEIFDESNKVTVSIKYSEFEYNKELNESLFKLD